jgi:hypothetical protein
MAAIIAFLLSTRTARIGASRPALDPPLDACHLVVYARPVREILDRHAAFAWVAAHS